MDYMELTHPRLHVAGQYFFVQWMKHFPSVYGYLFQKTREENTLIQMLKRFSTFSLHKLSTMLETEKPAIVVSTFPRSSRHVLIESNGLYRCANGYRHDGSHGSQLLDTFSHGLLYGGF